MNAHFQLDGFSFVMELEEDQDAEAPWQRDEFETEDSDRSIAWKADKWRYIGVIVTLDEEGIESRAESVWGVESDCEDYIEEVRKDLASEILRRLDRFVYHTRKAATA